MTLYQLLMKLVEDDIKINLKYHDNGIYYVYVQGEGQPTFGWHAQSVPESEVVERLQYLLDKKESKR